jgi:tryptophan synthase beta chain
LLQDDDGQIDLPHSISAGLDYPGVGPEHSYLKDLGLVHYESVTDDEAMQALKTLARTEGIICAIETAHCIHYALQIAPKMSRDETIIVCLSGRGDKDLNTIMTYFQM